MENGNVVMTDQQFAVLLEQVAPRVASIAEYRPEDDVLVTNLALDVLQHVSRNSYFPHSATNADRCPKFNALRDAIKALCREHI